MIATTRPPTDRLPQQIDPLAFYLNVDTRRPPRDAEAAPADKVPVILFDGSNADEVGQLAGQCDAIRYAVLALAPHTLRHIDGDVFGLDPADAYKHDGQRWKPTPEVIAALKELVAGDRQAIVLYE